MKVRNIIGLYVGQDLPHKLAYHNYDRLITLVLHDSPRLWKKNYTLDPNKMKDRNKKQNQSFFFFYCCCCFCDCHALFTVRSCTLDCHALVTVMHFLLKTEDFVQNRLPILHFWCFFFSKILHFLIPQTPTRCKNTSKSLPSLFL